MTNHVMGLAPDAGAVPADLVGCLAAIGRSMQDEFDPRRFLEEFSAKVERLIPHDRLVIACRDDDRTFTVFAEHAKAGPELHAEDYTTGFSPEGRYLLGDGELRTMLDGQASVSTISTPPTATHRSGRRARPVSGPRSCFRSSPTSSAARTSSGSPSTPPG